MGLLIKLQKQDLKKAFDLFTKSAAQGFDQAQFSLGTIYFEGNVVRQDLEKAQMYLRI